jgi:prevent-host-death family protein
MESIGIRELRDNLSRVLREVEQGKVYHVLRHGREVVVLRPVRTDPDQVFVERLRQMHLLGGGIGRIISVKTVRNRTPEKPLSDLVRENRR